MFHEWGQVLKNRRAAETRSSVLVRGFVAWWLSGPLWGALFGQQSSAIRGELLRFVRLLVAFNRPTDFEIANYQMCLAPVRVVLTLARCPFLANMGWRSGAVRNFNNVGFHNFG